MFCIFQVEYVIHYYGISHCIGFGVGFGANVLVRLAHRRPTMVDGLILVNCSSQSAGWLEWVYHKVKITIMSLFCLFRNHPSIQLKDNFPNVIFLSEHYSGQDFD